MELPSSPSRFLSITPSALVAIKIPFGGTLSRALYQELKARHPEVIKSNGSRTILYLRTVI